MYTDTKIGFIRDRSEDEYIYAQARIELERLERARERRKEIALNSFVDWMDSCISGVGRATGYIVRIPRIKLIELWRWLFDYQ